MQNICCFPYRMSRTADEPPCLWELELAMLPPTFELWTLRVLGERDNRYTTETVAVPYGWVFRQTNNDVSFLKFWWATPPIDLSIVMMLVIKKSILHILWVSSVSTMFKRKWLGCAVFWVVLLVADCYHGIVFPVSSSFGFGVQIPNGEHGKIYALQMNMQEETK